MPTHTVYVLLHGTISLIEEANSFRGIVIGMDEHRVAAGHFLCERTVPKGAHLTLEGVDPGEAGLDPDKNLLFEISSVDEALVARFSHAEIRLPKPKKLHSLRVGEWTSDFMTGKIAAEKQKGRFAALQVFEYSAADISKVKLSGASFRTLAARTPQFIAPDAPRNAVSTIHLLGEPETEPSTEHFIQEFNLGCQMFGVDLAMTLPLPFPSLEPGELPAGIMEEETLNLEQRAQPIVNLLAGVPRPGGPRGAGNNHFCGSVNSILLSH